MIFSHIFILSNDELTRREAVGVERLVGVKSSGFASLNPTYRLIILRTTQFQHGEFQLEK